VISQLGTQLLRILVVNHVKPQTAGTLKVERPVVDKDTLLRRALRDFESDAEDGLLRLARVYIAGTEKDEKIAPQIECFDAVLVELKRFVVDGTDEVLASAGGIGENGAGFEIFFGLGKHESGELFAGERTRAVKESAVELFVQRNLAGIKCGKRKIVPILKFFVVEVENFGGFAARATVPAVGKDDSADVPEERGDRSQMRGTSGRAAKASMIIVSR
jgi:hypothetical protein